MDPQGEYDGFRDDFSFVKVSFVSPGSGFPLFDRFSKAVCRWTVVGEVEGRVYKRSLSGKRERKVKKNTVRHVKNSVYILIKIKIINKGICVLMYGYLYWSCFVPCLFFFRDTDNKLRSHDPPYFVSLSGRRSIE